tara:strand:- start:786 stop:1892 length:1107 start_codon:yes stop_codon:yes gene_type:complete
MLKTNYQDNRYIFYLTFKDAEQYNAFGRFPVPIVGDRYLFKFTNDMSGAIKWAYSTVIELNDRYVKVEIYNTVLESENIYEGRVNFEPNGYWKYEVFWMYTGTEGDNCDLFNPLERGTWECTNSTGTVIDSGNLDVDSYEITGLVADTYTIKEYSTCNPPPQVGQVSTLYNTLTHTVKYNACVPTSQRELLFTKVVRKSESAEYHITSNAHVGMEIRFVGNVWTGRTYSYIVKTQPEDIVIEVTANVDGLDYADINPYNVYLYDGTTLLRNYSDGKAFDAVKKPATQRLAKITAYNDEWETACSFGTPLGSIFFTWENTGNSPNGGYITNLQAPIEIGKLLIGEPNGEEQVKYTQHESPNDTNYIYND